MAYSAVELHGRYLCRPAFMKGRTTRYFPREPLYPFGYGLSYTTFAYRNLTLPSAAGVDRPSKSLVHVEIQGRIRGEEVVQLDLNAVNPAEPIPLVVRVAGAAKELR